jgi:hypothetical protein
MNERERLAPRPRFRPIAGAARFLFGLVPAPKDYQAQEHDGEHRANDSYH